MTGMFSIYSFQYHQLILEFAVEATRAPAGRMGAGGFRLWVGIRRTRQCEVNHSLVENDAYFNLVTSNVGLRW